MHLVMIKRNKTKIYCKSRENFGIFTLARRLQRICIFISPKPSSLQYIISLAQQISFEPLLCKRYCHYAGYIAVNKLKIYPSSHGPNIIVGGGQSIKHELNIQYAK